ncbi:chaperonin 10-like protein [Melanogaster broomeanus]|nr:chaperonin 10-like protein [Melanogaster broomeanus]
MQVDSGAQSAVRWYPPGYDIRVEKVPIPTIEHPDDAIVKVKLAGLCGSDLHVYRGTEALTEPTVCGHEFIGEVVALGENFHPGSTGRPHLYGILKVGDTVVSPFTVSCGECHFCRVGFTCRCIESRLFGTPHTPGGQAQYVRVPHAGGTLYNLEGISAASVNPNQQITETVRSLSDSSLLLLCDILPTGVFAAFQALNHPKTLPMMTSRSYPQSSGIAVQDSAVFAPLQPEDKGFTIAVVGLGPVGVCACIAVLDMLYAKDIDFRIVAIDPTEARRTKVEAIYAKISQAQGEQRKGHLEVSDIAASKDLVSVWTKGAGCNAVLEVVGNTSALSLAYELVRSFGCITSVGVHADHQVPYTGRELYDKNVSLDFGRCPVRAMFPLALDLLIRKQDIFGQVGGETSLVEKIVGFDVAAQTYDDFDKGRCGKVLFDPWR